MASPKTVVYVDTSVVMVFIGFAILAGKSSEARRIYNKLLAMHHLIIPQIVLGEAVAVIYAREGTSRAALEYLEALLELCGDANTTVDSLPAPDSEVMDIARELSGISDVISNTDALVLAHAIANNYAVVLYTTDKAMGNDRVKQYIMDRIGDDKRDQNLDILNPFIEIDG